MQKPTMLNQLLCLTLCAASSLAQSLAVPEQAADLLLLGGRVVTLEADQPEVEAVAVKGTRIMALGSRVEMLALAAEHTLQIELGGKLVLPGFIEGHGHFLGLGRMRLELDLTRAQSFEEIVGMVEQAVRTTPAGEPIRGRGWHQDKWRKIPPGSQQGFPAHAALSAISPNNPVVLVHASGHAALANARAMELAGIRAATVDPPGGSILRTPDGEPLGAFVETAAGLLERALAGLAAPQTARLAELASQDLLAKGITSFHDAGTSLATARELRALAAEGRLATRLYVMLRDSTQNLEQGLSAARVVGFGDEFFTVRAIKESIDGALGSRGAWLLEPYADSPQSSGLNTLPLEVLARSAALASQHKFQLCVHAIGDRANREVLNLYEANAEANPDERDRRWRIEHAQHLAPEDIPRFAQLGVIASVQGIHCTSDGPWVPARLGEERSRTGAYRWRDLLESGAILCNGSDTPVEDADPIAGFYATVTRKMADGAAFFPEQSLERMQALRSYTIANAYAAFEEEIKGSLRPGKLADLVVLSHDILTVPEESIRDARVVMTILDGQVRYQR